MAIDDPIERLAFLNSGQAWVVRKLEAPTPKVRDDRLHADLRTMLDSHRVNIGLAAAFLKRGPDAGQEVPRGDNVR